MAADTARPLHEKSKSDGELEIDRLFATQKAAYAAEPFPTYDERSEWLDKIIRLTEANEQKFIEAINADFGARAETESIIAEFIVAISGAKLAKKNLRRWMRPRSVPTPLHMMPARSRIEPQPLGVVGIISPWNYPVQLALAPAVAALAAGNRVMIKPSELTPHTGEALKEAVASEFNENICAVVTGGVETGIAFSETPFDHLLFTGSTAVGMRVAEAAAKNLTPVTLELGGKSPVVIDKSADIDKAASSIAYGKLFNAGQTCVAPDYILAPEGKTKETISALEKAARKLFPQIDTTSDYSSIISDRHFARLKEMVNEARDRGAEVVEVGSANALHPQRKMPFTIIANPPSDSAVMQEEIFGPVLPVIDNASTETAIAKVNAGDRPLALYWFGEDQHARDEVLEKTVAGGVTINDTMWHVAQENLPFGGVGKSGIGAYHGEAGFETFSHMKPVFYQSRFANGAALRPPYTEKTGKLIALFRKLI